MWTHSWRRAAFSAALLAMAGCATARRDVQTPAGAVAGQVNGPFVVLGVAARATSTLNRVDGTAAFEETVRIDVPAGTELIVPALNGWDLGFGSTDPADLSTQPPPGDTFHWNANDHHLGMAAINVVVVALRPPRPGATTQSATIRIGARLNDVNGDDGWWGVVRYQLIYLGRAP